MTTEVSSHGPEIRVETLRPDSWLRTLMGFCLCASVIYLLILIPGQPPLFVTLAAWFGAMAPGLFAIYSHRQQILYGQRRLNSGATDFIKDHEFILYLRPFVTSRALPVPCLLPHRLDRWLVGWYWDLELALSLALMNPPLLFVAVGDTRKSFGAAKLVTSDDHWQELVGTLTLSAQVIAIVPYSRPGTLWEILKVFNDDRLLPKTIFIMPPLTRWQNIVQSLIPWRPRHASRWHDAKAKLAEYGIELPSYRRRGALLLVAGRGFEIFETRGFNPDYLANFFGMVGRRRAHCTSDQEFWDELRREAAKYSYRRPFLDYLLFFRFSPTWILASSVVGLSLVTFLFQPFNIPSGSMIPTLLVGDVMFVSKYSYGYTHYSLPLSLPIFTGRILGQPVSRGDVVVFRLPRQDSTTWVKRVVGLPDDRIQMIDGVLNINDQPVKRERIQDYDLTNDNGAVQRVKRYRETLPNGIVYTTLDLVEDSFLNNTPIYKVPPDHYFMMGDNRDNSNDSRLREVGYVPYQNVVGKVQVVYFSIEDPQEGWKIWRWPWTVRWGRLFKTVR